MHLFLKDVVWHIYETKVIRLDTLWLSRQIKRGEIPAIKNAHRVYMVEKSAHTLEAICALWLAPRNRGGRPKGVKDKIKRKKRRVG